MKQPTTLPTDTWHTLSVDSTLARVESEPRGLTAEEAARRLVEFGANELRAVHGVSPLVLLLEQFKNLLILILLAATVVSAFLGHEVEAIAITVIVLFAVLLGFLQEYRAERAIEALREMAAPAATTLRGGKEVELPARDLVPGDVILLRAGNRVPADVRLIESVNLQIEESALTGESVPVEKHVEALDAADCALGDRRNMGYAGTTATYGRGRAVVVATGMATEFGRIARMLQTIETSKTPLQENLDKVGRTLVLGALAVVAVVVALGIFRGQPFIEMLIFGIALAVAVVPEALPAVVTISLAIGVQRMVRRHALMRRLPAVETLGCTSVICSDKTGTLTRDEMTVRRLFVSDRMVDVSGAGYEPRGEFSSNGGTVEHPGPLHRLLEAAVLASDARVLRGADDGAWQVKGDPTEGALVVAAAKAGLEKDALDRKLPRVIEIPFTSESKRMTTLHDTPTGVTAFSKGAPEVILATCDKRQADGGTVVLDPAGREAIVEAARRMAGDALRVLAVSMKPAATRENAESAMTFLGLVGMIDPPRPEAKAAIRTCGEAGIKVVMITGDHPLTAGAVARELGLLTTGRIVVGADLDAMDETRLAREVESIEVYARVSPAHKLRVVNALQQNGHVVAMTGDGVNDAPALKKADIGVAMGITGTDVTKEAAAMTLTDDNFASIVAAVEEGRGIFGNIKKYLMYLLSSNIGEMLLVAVATLAGVPLPLTAVQLLIVNLVTDGLPALALAVDPNEPGIMRRRPRDPRTGIFTRPVVTLMLVGGLWSAAVNMGLFVWARQSGRSLVEAMTMTFLSLILIQFFKAYNFRAFGHSVLKAPFANRWLNLAILGQLSLLPVIVYVPFLQGPFGTFGLSIVDWGIILVLAFSVSPVLELAKAMERRGWFGKA
jgi:Ca2+-transporting ATPase